MPSPQRALLAVLATLCISVALYCCIRGAVMLYEWYQIIEWMREVSR